MGASCSRKIVHANITPWALGQEDASCGAWICLIMHQPFCVLPPQHTIRPTPLPCPLAPLITSTVQKLSSPLWSCKAPKPIFVCYTPAALYQGNHKYEQ
eukprot:1147687-Pelagomonas_calceolata.AAC.4